MLAGLAYVHNAGWLHRDLSPNNLFLTSTGAVKILDFGLCRAIELSGALTTITGPAIFGTPGFIAPEQACSAWANVDVRSDIWSVGAILFHLLSGEPVHPGSIDAQMRAAAKTPARSIRDALPELTTEIAEWVDRALAFEPRNRWANAEEMRCALKGIRASGKAEGVLVQRERTAPIAQEGCRSTLSQFAIAECKSQKQWGLRLVHSPDTLAVREVRFGETDALTIGRRPEEQGSNWAIHDPRMSRCHARFQFDGSSRLLRVVDLASRNGVRVNGTRHNTMKLAPGDVLRLADTLIVVIDQSALNERSVAVHTDNPRPPHVLIQGEIGVGKEHLARQIHARSRRSGPFIPVDCASLNHDSAIRSLLGADCAGETPHVGLLEAAGRGTLFLSEVTQLSVTLQALLAKALTRVAVCPSGGTSARMLDIRVIASSSVLVKDATLAGSFRFDLRALLSGVVISVPPLRERRCEILPILEVLTAEHGLAVQMTPDAAEAIVLGDWPCNVYGLKQLAAQLTNRSSGGVLDLPLLQQLQPELVGQLNSRRNATACPSTRIATVSAVLHQRPALLALLSKHGGNVATAAKELNVARAQVYRWMKRFGIEIDAIRGLG